MRFGRIYKGVVVSVTEPSIGRTIEQHVGEDQAVHYAALPEGVGVGYVQQLDETWLSPQEVEAKKAKKESSK
jgi:hypothetical protein